MKNRKIASAILLLSFAVTSLLPQASFAEEANVAAPEASAAASAPDSTAPAQADPAVAPVAAPQGIGTVTFVMGDGEKAVEFQSLDEQIVKPALQNEMEKDLGGGMTKRYFIFWSTIPNYSGSKAQLAAGAKGFYGTEPIQSAFPNGIPEGAKLYATYLDQASVLTLAEELKGDIAINELVTDTDAHYNTFPVKDGKNVATNNNTITYLIGDDVKAKNNIKLGASFKYNPFMNAVARYSPSHYFQPGTAEHYGVKDKVSTSADVKETGYTFVDLHIKLDERVDLADTLNFQLKSYAWKPLMVLTRDYKKVEGVNIVTPQGNPLSDISLPTATLVAKEGTKEFIVRTQLRDKSEIPQASYEEANVENDMELISTNDNNFSLAKEVIETIADKKAQPVVIKGEIKGGAKLYATNIAGMALGGPTEIPKTEAQAVLFNYERGAVTVIFDKNYADGKDTVIAKEDVVKGQAMKAFPKNPERSGYKFLGWSKDKAAKKADATQPKATDLYNESATFYAIWEQVVSGGGGGGGAVPVPTPSNPKTPDALNSVDHMHYIVGYPDSTVRPNKNITRAEITSVYYRLLNDKKRDEIFTKVNGFKDVKVTNWYNKAVSSMTNGKYISGYPDGTFGGNKPMTRAEFVAVTARFLDKKASNKTFVDVKENHWAKEAISAGAAYGWLSGYEDGTFRPDQAITRAEAMAIINRLLDRGVDENGLKQVDYKKWVDNEKGKWYYYEVIEATNDHKYTGKRPNEVWTSLKIERVYDYDKYEKPGK